MSERLGQTRVWPRAVSPRADLWADGGLRGGLEPVVYNRAAKSTRQSWTLAQWRS